MNSVVNAAVSVLGEPGVVEPDPLARQRPVDVDGERDRLHLRQRIGEKEVGAAPVGPSHALLAPSSREVVSSLAVLCLGPTADICKGALDHDFPEFLGHFPSGGGRARYNQSACLEAAWERNCMFTIPSEATRFSKAASYI